MMTSRDVMVRRDGSIRVWDIFNQSWDEYRPGVMPPDEVIGSLSQRERDRICRAVSAHEDDDDDGRAS